VTRTVLKARKTAKPPAARSAKKIEAKMSIEYLLVTFPEERAVQANGTNVGFTNHTLMLPADEYTVTLSGAGYAPATQDVVLTGTAVMKPLVVAFARA